MSETIKKRLGKVPSIRRLPLYLDRLIEYKNKGITIVTSSELAKEMGMLPIVVKKDLQLVEPPTKKRAGYLVDGTIDAIQSFLDWHQPYSAVLVGVGNLGSALLGYHGFNGINFIGAFDIDKAKIGQSIHGVPVHDLNHFSSFATKKKIDIVILATPASVAQETVNKISMSPIKAIWNFTPAKLHVLPHIALQREDLSAGLAELCAKIKHNKQQSFF